MTEEIPVEEKAKKTCFQCDSKHSPDYCHFKYTTCNFCQKTGHISAACLKRKSTKGIRNHWIHKVTEMNMTTILTLLLQKTVPQSTNSSTSHGKKYWPSNMGINDRWVEMEIDTGAAVSLISRTIFDRRWQEPNKPKLGHIAQKLVTYTGENITPCGTCEVTVTYDN